MPRYLYRCEKCEYENEYFHSITDKIEICETCKEKSMYKVPNFSGIMKKNTNSKIGTLVDSYIQETKEEIRKEKTRLSIKDYTPE